MAGSVFEGSQTMKTILVGGCFDFIHFGHVKFLSEAKKHGDKLVVMLESDETIKHLKGDDRPFHTQAQRKIMLKSLRMVDEIILLHPHMTDADYFETIKKIKPDSIAFTEGDPILEKKLKQTETIGASAIIIPKVLTHSTSSLAKLLKLE